MRTVEDGVELLAEQVNKVGSILAFDGLLSDDWTRSFLENVHVRVGTSHALSTQQGSICLKLIGRVGEHLVGSGLVTADELARLMAQPVFRIVPYPSRNVPREVVHMGDDKLGFRFKWDPLIVREIKNLAAHGMVSRPWFDAQYSIWLVPISRHTMEPVMRIITAHRFSFGEDVVSYLERCAAMRNKPSRFTIDDPTGLLLASVHDNVLLASWVMHVERGELV